MSKSPILRTLNAIISRTAYHRKINELISKSYPIKDFHMKVVWSFQYQVYKKAWHPLLVKLYFVWTGISRGKVKNLKIPGGFPGAKFHAADLMFKNHTLETWLWQQWSFLLTFKVLQFLQLGHKSSSCPEQKQRMAHVHVQLQNTIGGVL